MTIKLYKNLSDKLVTNKNILLIATLTGSLRNSTSLINPIIEIQSAFNLEVVDNVVDEDNYEIINIDNIEVGIAEQLTFTDVNYIYIEEFKRYYYVIDIQIINNNLYGLVCEEDVLMSLKNQFLELEGFINRNRYEYDSSIIDDAVSYSYDKEVYYVNPDNMSSVKTLKTSTLNPNIIISYLTDDEIYYSGSTPLLDILPVISSYVSGGNIKTQYLACNGGMVRDIIKEVYKNDKLKSFIKSVTAYPFDIDAFSEPSKTSIKIGSQDVNLTDTFRYPQHYPDRIVIADFILNGKYNDYRDYSPYTTYELFIPYCQSIQLSGETFLNQRIKIFYMINYEDATSTAYVYNETKQVVLFCANAQLGVKLGLSSTNATEIKNQKNALALNTAVGVLGSTIAVTSGITSGNTYASAQGVLSGASTIGNAITSANQMYDIGRIEISSAVDGLSNNQFAYFKITEMKAINEPSTSEFFGKPLKQKRLLSSLTGYTEIGDIHLDNVDATKTEIDELSALLKNGIIL